jgi:hypothetical protein
MDKKLKINPLNVFEMRRVKFCPPHFESTTVALTYNMSKALEAWIDEHTRGRYYIGTRLDSNIFDGSKGRVKYSTVVSFETSKDLSYFLLACPYLKY